MNKMSTVQIMNDRDEKEKKTELKGTIQRRYLKYKKQDTLLNGEL
jgi:hypothetical protein